MLTEHFEAGDAAITATLTTGATGAYRLQTNGTSISTNNQVVTIKAVQEGDNDLLAIIAGGRRYSDVTFGVVHNDGGIDGASVTNANLDFGAQLGDRYDDPCFCCTPVCGC